MAITKIHVFSSEESSERLFEQFVLIARHVHPAIGKVSSQALSSMVRQGLILTPLQKRALLAKESDGTFLFTAESLEELDEIKEWRAMPNHLKKGVLDVLWMPTHCHELSFESITACPDLLEDLYQIILEAIINRKIRFKEGSKSLRIEQLSRSTKKRERHQHFLEVINRLNRQYSRFRYLALKNRFREELLRHAPEVPDLIDDFSLLAFEIIQAEEHPDTKECALVKECHKQLIKRICDSLTETARPKILRRKARTASGRQALINSENSGLFQFAKALEMLPMVQLLRILKEEEIPTRRALVTFLLRRKLFHSLPSELQSFLGPKAMQLLSPGQLYVILQVLADEKVHVAARTSIPDLALQQPFSWKFRQLFNRKKHLNIQPNPKENLKQIGVVDMVKAVGGEILPQLSSDKLAVVLSLSDEDVAAKLAAGFNRFLPHIKAKQIEPLARFFGTPLWEIVRSLRFLNNINQEILSQLDSLVDRDLLDVPFARLLAGTFRHKLERLRIFQLEEVEKNADVILFFKEAFLSFKKGVTRLATKHLNLLRKNQELIPYLHQWKAPRLDSLLSNQVRLRKFLLDLAQPETRTIILESDF